MPSPPNRITPSSVGQTAGWAAYHAAIAPYSAPAQAARTAAVQVAEDTFNAALVPYQPAAEAARNAATEAARIAFVDAVSNGLSITAARAAGATAGAAAGAAAAAAAAPVAPSQGGARKTKRNKKTKRSKKTKSRR